MKPFFLEAVMTFVFTLVFLYMKFKAIYITSDEILKGLTIAIALYTCLAMTAGSGGCLNPWFGLA
jgi:glycerol uptake facilitator-like aquaporin